MEKPFKKSGISGASIIEILISLVIVAMLLVAIVAVFPKMTSHRKAISEADQARLIAAEVLAGVQTFTRDPLNNPCQGAAAGKPDYQAFKSYYAVGGITIGAVRFLVDAPSFNTGTNGGITCAGVNTATITVKWNKNGKVHSVKVTGAIL